MIENVFIETEDPRWLKCLKTSQHDLYHLPAYAQLEAEWVGARAIAYLYRENDATMLLVLLERPLPSGDGTDVVSPYGYSSPVVSPQGDEAFLNRALSAYDEAARARGILSTFIRLHPIFRSELPALQHGTDMRRFQIARGSTVTMPMADEPELWLKGLASGHRFDLRKLKRNGCRFVIDTDNVWSAFPHIYRTTMERIGAQSAYFYTDEYLAAFRERLDGHVHCAAIQDADGEIMCASIFTLVNGLLQYHLSGTRPQYFHQAPTKLLLAEIREWARNRGIRLFHLGGGYGSGRDKLFEFKHRFGGQELTFRTVSIIHDAKKFEAECEAWKARYRAQLAGPEGFFPPYRMPFAAVH